MFRAPISSSGPHGLFAATASPYWAQALPTARTSKLTTPIIPSIATIRLMAHLLVAAVETDLEHGTEKDKPGISGIGMAYL